MKSIENFTVLNTWALLVDFLNEHWFIVTATSTEIFIPAFMARSADASATRTMKGQDTKRAFKPNFPAIRPKAILFEPRQIWYQNAPNSR